MLEETNDLNQVIEYLLTLKESFSNDHKYISKLGYFLYEAGRFEEAQNVLESSIKIPKLLPVTSLLTLASIYSDNRSL